MPYILLFSFSNDPNYRHFDPDIFTVDRGDSRRPLKAVFRCYEDYDRARAITLRFKVEHVSRTEQFRASLNGQPLEPARQKVLYAANGRDTRIHTVALKPYLEYEVPLKPIELRKGENVLEVTPTRLVPHPAAKINLVEIELRVGYGG